MVSEENKNIYHKEVSSEYKDSQKNDGVKVDFRQKRYAALTLILSISTSVI